MVLGERTFGVADQEWFAAASGDINPMHMDALAARRTMAGRPVVHGIHAVLWALDAFFHTNEIFPPIALLKVDFEKMIYVGETVTAAVEDRDDTKLTLAVRVGPVTVFSIGLTFGPAVPDETTGWNDTRHRPDVPIDLTFEEAAEMRGTIPLPDAAALRDAFPAASAALGVHRVAWLAGSSYLVGMVCPGLHSIYRSLQVQATDTTDAALRFKVKYDDEDYRFLRLAVAGSGWSGQIDSNARPAPTEQKGIADIAGSVARDAFAGTTALVIGGSRGLGEVVAKLLAAGGAEVIVTYVVGEADATRLRDEIRAVGGACEIARYDVTRDAAAQIAALPVVPNQLYYMATPAIFQRAGSGFDAARFGHYLQYYVNGFDDLCRVLRQANGTDIPAFYPSSVAVESRPANMTEYSMAKAAGEILCADMRQFGKWRKIVVERLPRLPTDQTATLFEDESDDPVAVMRPIVLAMH